MVSRINCLNLTHKHAKLESDPTYQRLAPRANNLETKSSKQGILYFDGVCLMCSNFIDFLLKRDKKHTTLFATLQGSTAKENLPSEFLGQLYTIVYQEKNETLTKSDAVIKAISNLGGIWKIILVFKIIPKAVRDSVYNYISTNRFKWFKKNEVCRIPTAEEKDRLLP